MKGVNREMKNRDMKTIVFGDVHGCYDELKELWEMVKEAEEYNKEVDKVVFLGDYIDRGKDSRKVIEFIRNLQKENKNVIALMGNHEDMLLSYYKGFDEIWTYNGCDTTLASYIGFEEQLKDDMKWMHNLPLYHEDEYFVYVHAGINTTKPLEEQDKNTLLWIRESFIYSANEYHKKVVFGHTPTVFLTNEYKPIYTQTKNIDIDTGCVYGGKLTALIIEHDKAKCFYYVDNKEAENNVM